MDPSNTPMPFEAVDREFRPKLLRYLAGLVGSNEAADLTQVTMLKVSRHLAEFRGESSLATWIYRIATNVAFDRLRQREPERVSLDDAMEDDAVTGVPDALQVASTETAAVRRQMSACVREFVDALPAHYRLVLVLSDIEGLTNSEIAGVAGVSLETVKIRLHRARATLRERLRAGCAIGRDDRNEVVCDRRRAAA